MAFGEPSTTSFRDSSNANSPGRKAKFNTNLLQNNTWITADMKQAFSHLHALGHAHSVEAWEGDTLVGGLYGVVVGRLFSGESMFASRPDASKIAFAQLIRQLERWDFPLVDCQVHTDHLATFGAKEIDRATYLELLADVSRSPATQPSWTFDADLSLRR